METISLGKARRSGRWKKIIIVSGLIIIVAAILLTKNQRQNPGPGQGGHQRGSQEAMLSGSEPSERADAAKQRHMEPLPRLIDLGADKCIPCKMMAPVLEELRGEYRGRFAVEFIDVWKDPQAGRQWRIRVIPTQIFLDGSGKELYRHEGFFSKEDILQKWKELGMDVEREVGLRDEQKSEMKLASMWACCEKPRVHIPGWGNQRP
jgi:thiol-disulfide isomerase/thioredoxin